MSLSVKQVGSRADVKAFIDLPWQIYRDDPHWVPPLRRDVRRIFDRAACPFYEHGNAAFFLARRGGRPQGRIAAIQNDLHRETYGEPVGYFGFFECVRDRQVSEGLFSAAIGWLRTRNLDVLRGPINFSMNDECGLLLGPFDSSPFILMPYNPEYYIGLIDDFGFQKVKDLYAYEGRRDLPVPERISRLVEFARARTRVRIRSFRMRDRHRDIRAIKSVYNAAFRRHWGTVPLTDREIDAVAESLLWIGDPDLVRIAEDGEKAVGFVIAIPDMNQAMKRANGRLFPFGWAKMWMAKRTIDAARVIAIGVHPAHRLDGIDILLCIDAYQAGLAKGYERVEMSWILEDNHLVRSALERSGASISKTYRIYDLAI